MRGSSVDGAIGAMLAAASGVPSAGQKPASFGNTRWQIGQLFMSAARARRTSVRAYRARASERKSARRGPRGGRTPVQVPSRSLPRRSTAIRRGLGARGCLHGGLGRGEVDDAMAGGALLEDRLAA